MINLMTTRRKIATLFALTATVISSAAEAQDANNAPLLQNNVPASVIEKQTYDGPDLPPEIQPAAAVPVREELPSSMAFDDETLPEIPTEIDVLTRGPLHEAFATAHQSNPESSPVVTQAPPELIDEVPPEYKPEGSNVQWIPGYWAWDDAQQDFIWISGVWRDVPPKRRWVPGYWDQANSDYRWISGFWAEETQQELGYLPAPPVTIEQGPSTAAPSENHFYVPGNWQYQDDRYRWLSGHWQPVVENWIWIPAQYVWTPSGCIYRTGYWDYEFDHRGTCFAPVHFTRPVYLATNYCYRPSFAINLNINFLTHLFVRPRCGHYYYGDWYSSNFVNSGYRPWVSYHSHYRSYDPLLTYYRCRRSSFDRRYNTVQYLAQQHRFYANNISYRPRPTFAAQFNFSKNNYKKQHRHSDYLRKSNYVKSYSNIRNSAQRDSQRRSPGQQLTNNRLELDLQGRDVKYRRVQDDEFRSNRQKIEQLTKLQRDRKKNEIRLASNNINDRTPTRRHRTLKLPASLSTNQNQKLRKEFPTTQRTGKGKVKQPKIENDRSDELRKAVAASRKKAASQERSQRQREQNKQNSIKKQRDDAEQQRQQLNQLANQRNKLQANLNSSQLQREQQNRLQKEQRQSEDQTRERTRLLQQQQRVQETARNANRQKNEQTRRAQADRQQRATQQQRGEQEQAQRSRDHVRKAQADRARQASSRQTAQDAQRDSARQAQQKAQRDAVRQAQQKAQRDAARQARQKKKKK